MSDDRTLVAAVIARRDERAFGRLYDGHSPALYGLALRLLAGDAAGAQDVVHETWLRAVARFPTFRWEASLRTWLCAIAVRVTHETRRAAMPDALTEQAVAAEDDRLRGVYDRVDLERAIAALPPGFRRVLVLHDIEGLTHEEIGRLLAIAPGTSKSQLARARGALRRALDPPTGG